MLNFPSPLFISLFYAFSLLFSFAHSSAFSWLSLVGVLAFSNTPRTKETVEFHLHIVDEGHKQGTTERSCYFASFRVRQVSRYYRDSSFRYFQIDLQVYQTQQSPENVLLDANGVLKLSDFGSSALPKQVRVILIRV